MLGACVVIAVIAALVSAIPVIRPWEYYNETVGTTEAYRYFSDEGTDLGQRSPDIFRYFDNLKESGEIPYLQYSVKMEEAERRGMQARWWNADDIEPEKLSNVVAGTFLSAQGTLLPLSGTTLLPYAMPSRHPASGTSSSFGGHLNSPGGAHETSMSARWTISTNRRRISKSPSSTWPNRSSFISQNYAAAIELGNLLMKRNARDAAIQAYETARSNAPPGDPIQGVLAKQIEVLSTQPTVSVTAIRNPWLE